MLAVLFVLAMAGVASAQGNDFPPVGIAPPIGAPPSIPGIPANPSCCYSGTAWGPHTLFGVEKGDTVYIRAGLTWWGLSPLYIFPRCEGCLSGPTYNEPTDGTASRTAQWYWPGLGEFCVSCEFKLVAGDDNPTIWFDFWGGSNFGWNVVITGIEKAPRLVEPVVKQNIKDKARGGAIAMGVVSGLAFSGAAMAVTVPPFSAGTSIGLMVLGAVTSYIGYEFDRVANDPWDPDYASQYSPNYHPDLVGMKDWVCQTVDAYSAGNPDYADWFCPMYLEASLATELWLRAAAVTNDRVESCIIAQDACMFWQRDVLVDYVRTAGAWSSWLGYLHQVWADYLYSANFNTEDDLTGWIRWSGIVIQDAGWELQGAY